MERLSFYFTALKILSKKPYDYVKADEHMAIWGSQEQKKLMVKAIFYWEGLQEGTKQQKGELLGYSKRMLYS